MHHCTNQGHVCSTGNSITNWSNQTMVTLITFQINSILIRLLDDVSWRYTKVMCHLKLPRNIYSVMVLRNVLTSVRMLKISDLCGKRNWLVSHPCSHTFVLQKLLRGRQSPPLPFLVCVTSIPVWLQQREGKHSVDIFSQLLLQLSTLHTGSLFVLVRHLCLSYQ